MSYAVASGASVAPVEVSFSLLREPGQRDHRRRDDLDRSGLAGRLVGRAEHRAGPVTAELLAELELGGERVDRCGLGLQRDETYSVDPSGETRHVYASAGSTMVCSTWPVLRSTALTI